VPTSVEADTAGLAIAGGLVVRRGAVRGGRGRSDIRGTIATACWRGLLRHGWKAQTQAALKITATKLDGGAVVRILGAARGDNIGTTLASTADFDRRRDLLVGTMKRSVAAT
jgi:hypothetical protein